MQISSMHDGFDSQRFTYRRPVLSSEIVRPVFQRDPVQCSSNDGQQIEARWSRKRSMSPHDSPELSPKKRALPPLPSALTSPSTEARTIRSPQQTQTQTFASQPANSEDLVMMATCVDSEASSSADITTKRKRVRLKTQRRREQCRANQARYRMKQLTLSRSLEESVQSLRAEIPELELQRNRLKYGGIQQSVWSVVVEYFHNFCFGVPVAAAKESGQPASKWVEKSQSTRQLTFLRYTMSKDLVLGELCGVDALMDQWRRYSTYFQSLYFQLESIQRASEMFVMVTASLYVTVSETTLEAVFPHLLHGEKEKEDDQPSKGAVLGSKLLGCRLLLPCSLCFEWDATGGCVARLQTTMNLLTPLTQALGSLADAAFVMERALISPDGAIGVCEDSDVWRSFSFCNETH